MFIIHERVQEGGREKVDLPKLYLATMNCFLFPNSEETNKGHMAGTKTTVTGECGHCSPLNYSPPLSVLTATFYSMCVRFVINPSTGCA